MACPYCDGSATRTAHGTVWSWEGIEETGFAVGTALSMMLASEIINALSALVQTRMRDESFAVAETQRVESTVLRRWDALSRGWKATLFGVLIVGTHLLGVLP